jgi:hypothetical protein
LLLVCLCDGGCYELGGKAAMEPIQTVSATMTAEVSAGDLRDFLSVILIAER